MLIAQKGQGVEKRKRLGDGDLLQRQVEVGLLRIYGLSEEGWRTERVSHRGIDCEGGNSSEAVSENMLISTQTSPKKWRLLKFAQYGEESRVMISLENVQLAKIFNKNLFARSREAFTQS